MQFITRLILSILAFAFAIWVFVIAYRMWRGTWQPDESQTVLLIIVFLVLSCTYILTTTIQKGAKVIAQKEADSRKIVLYENITTTFLGIISTGEDDKLDNLAEKLVILKAHVGVHANIRVMQSFNKFHYQYTHNASNEELKASYTDLVLNMRSDLGKNNISVKEELQQLQ